MTIPRSVAGGCRPLVIGYGNPHGGDDVVGWLVACSLLDDARACGIDVVAAHQLCPEHAVRIAGAGAVVLVGAELGGIPPLPPGHWAVHRAGEDRSPLHGAPPEQARGRRCTSAALVAMAVGLHRSVGPIHLVEVGAASLDPGEHPSIPIVLAVPPLVELVIGLALEDRPWDPGGAQTPRSRARYN